MGKTYTSNYNLTKDDENEFYNVAVQSENMDLIDGALKALSDEKVSHIEGKGLSTNDYSDAEKQKLAKIPEDAIDYQHPATHSLDMITETGSRKIFSSAERTKLSGIDEGANNYTHPSSHSLDMITETAAKKIMTSAERSKLSGIQSGAQVNAVTSVAGKTGAVTLAKADVGLSSVANYGVATTAEAEAGTSNAKYMTPLTTKQAINLLSPIGETIENNTGYYYDGYPIIYVDTFNGNNLLKIRTSTFVGNIVIPYVGNIADFVDVSQYENNLFDNGKLYSTTYIKEISPSYEPYCDFLVGPQIVFNRLAGYEHGTRLEVTCDKNFDLSSFDYIDADVELSNDSIGKLSNVSVGVKGSVKTLENNLYNGTIRQTLRVSIRGEYGFKPLYMHFGVDTENTHGSCTIKVHSIKLI